MGVTRALRDAISRASQRWNVGAALLSAQLYAESGFDPDARSPAGAQGIAQFMPGTAAGYGLSNPFDAEAAIDAQAHLMHDLLGQLGSVPLALAAYNAGRWSRGPHRALRPDRAGGRQGCGSGAGCCRLPKSQGRSRTSSSGGRRLHHQISCSFEIW
jgi:soluble lytic murein transglycosylase-like protein